jgi:hypothetical protein
MNSLRDKFTDAAVLTDSKSAVSAMGNLEPPETIEVKCRKLMSKNKIIVLQLILGQCDISGNEKADPSETKATLITQTTHREKITHCQNHNPKDFQDDERPETGNKNIAKTLKRLNCQQTPDCPRSEAFANFWT